MADWYKASLGPETTASTTNEDTATTAASSSSQPPTSSSSSSNNNNNNNDLFFNSRRSAVLCRHAAVATSQPLASEIGLSLLKQNNGTANAADAAVAIAAALAVLEPCSTGLGGDMFCLYYDARSQQVSCINGSGRSPAALTRQVLEQQYPSSNDNNDNNTATGSISIDAQQFCFSPHAVTVPGAAQGWQDLWQRHGSGTLSLAQLVEPAAQLAQEGFPVAPVTAHHWQQGFAQILKWFPEEKDDTTTTALPLVKAGTQRTPPSAGDIVVNADLARVLRDLGRHGAQDGFYQPHAETARAMVDIVQEHGGCLTLDDLAAHTSSTFPEPLSTDYRGFRLWQVPPNGQGVAALIALQGLQHLEREHVIEPLTRESLDTAEGYHALLEMMRLGFADARAHVADPNAAAAVGDDFWLDPHRIGTRAAQLYDPHRAVVQGIPDPASCTVSFQVVDRHGNAVSFVNSNFMGFGTGLVPRGCGFTLQNRGFGFTLDDANHPNAVGPNKRPYHTIIPGLLTHADTGELYATLSNMGGNMQPQGHLQLTVAMVAGGWDPQTAIDRPRFCIADGTHNGHVFLEEGVDPQVVEELRRRGHVLRPNQRGHDRCLFGRAQIIRRDRATGVLWAGSDGRSDGCAMGY